MKSIFIYVSTCGWLPFSNLENEFWFPYRYVDHTFLDSIHFSAQVENMRL